jgi:tetratricopeptide (TPR) repeat protein
VADTSAAIESVPSSALTVDSKLVNPEQAERHALRKYLARQFIVLTQRHSPEDAILVRVIADYHGAAVQQAKQGHLEAARAILRRLENLARLDEAELLITHRVTALPASALIHWYEGDHDEAIRLLKRALDACLELATGFGHDYLTAKRIHLAANTARVLASLGSLDRALSRVAALKTVVAGERAWWPFEGPESLDVPLNYPERFFLEEQLARIATIVKKTRLRDE